MADPRVEIMFSGLVLFVRDAEARQEVTHVLLRDARNHEHDPHHSRDSHDPYVCVCDPRMRIPLDRQQLEFRWYDDDDNELQVDRAGALPRGGVDDLDPLPDQNNEEFFYWTPYLGRGRTVDRRCLGTRSVPPAVVASVRLHEGRLYTADMAFVEQRKGLVWEQLAAVFRFRDTEGGGGRLREQACSEMVRWEPDMPSGATRLRIYAKPFWDGVPEPDAVLLWQFQLSEDQPLRLTISNNSRPVVGRKRSDRGPGAKAEHFEMFYDLLVSPPPRERRPIPHAPPQFRSRDVGSLLRNVVPYTARGNAFADCHRLRDTCRGTVRKGWRRLFDKIEILSTKERPICVPAVADAAPAEEVTATALRGSGLEPG